jgi:hypothetical protein
MEFKCHLIFQQRSSKLYDNSNSSNLTNFDESKPRSNPRYELYNRVRVQAKGDVNRDVELEDHCIV